MRDRGEGLLEEGETVEDVGFGVDVKGGAVFLRQRGEGGLVAV